MDIVSCRSLVSRRQLFDVLIYRNLLKHLLIFVFAVDLNSKFNFLLSWFYNSDLVRFQVDLSWKVCSYSIPFTIVLLIEHIVHLQCTIFYLFIHLVVQQIQKNFWNRLFLALSWKWKISKVQCLQNPRLQ